MADRSITMRCERCNHTRAITETQAVRIMDEAVPSWADEIHTDTCDRCDPGAASFASCWGRLVATGTLVAHGAETDA